MSSPFTHHFNTNYVLSDNEVVTIRGLISQGKMIMDDIQQRKGAPERELRELENRWKAQKREVEGHKALLSPIKRIPVDILSSIFLAALEGYHGLPQKISAHHSAIVISHVCRSWRNLAISTKLLWCNLLIDIPPCVPFTFPNRRWAAKVAKLVELAQVWISRSDDCHLSVDLTDRTAHGRSGRDIEKLFSKGTDLDKLVDTLVASSSRWKSLKLKTVIPQTELLRHPTIRLLTLPPQSTPKLTEVELFCGAMGHQLNSPVSQTTMAGPSILGSPTLRSLVIAARPLFDDIMRIPAIWSNLEHLSFGRHLVESSHRFDVLGILSLFKECPNLVTCQLILEDAVAQMPTMSEAPISLPRLKKLVFVLENSDLPKGFAQHLILPSLRQLDVLYDGDSRGVTPRGHHESGLFEFLDRFGGTLDDVAFCYLALTQPALLHCLKCLPNIISLGLFSPRDALHMMGDPAAASLGNVDLFLQLTPQVDVLPLCPKMQVLQFNPCRDEVLAEEAFLDFVAARRREEDGVPGEVARLREVDCGDYFFVNVEPREGLRERGVEVDHHKKTRLHIRVIFSIAANF
ncbi:hypothetical protein MD484_g4883, partial [Candolleomyces efflorescens]